MSRPSHTATVTLDQCARTLDDRCLIVHVAVFTVRQDVRRGEDALGQLCAEAALEILDGMLLDWPGAAAHPAQRPLQNLPRTSALPSATWSALLGCLQPAATGDLLPRPAAPLTPGRSSIVAFSTARTPDPVRRQLEGVGAQVTTAPVSMHRYAQLRCLE